MVEIPFDKDYLRKHYPDKYKELEKNKASSPTPQNKNNSIQKQSKLPSMRDEGPKLSMAEIHEVLYGDIKLPTEFDKFISEKPTSSDELELSQIAWLAKTSAYVLMHLKRWGEEKIAGKIEYWYRMANDPFTRRLNETIGISCEDLLDILSVRLPNIQQRFKDQYEKLLSAATNADKEQERKFATGVNNFKRAAISLHGTTFTIHSETIVQIEKLTGKKLAKESGKKMDNKGDAEKLREIARKLSAWKESGPESHEHSIATRSIAEEAMRGLGSNEDLIHHCKETFGVKNRRSEKALKTLYGIWDDMHDNNKEPEHIIERIGYYDYQDFAQDDFINELQRWAKEMTGEIGRLDSKILEYARRLIQVEIKKRQKPFHNKVSRKGRELQLNGNQPESSSTGEKIFRNLFTEELENIASVVWKNLQRAHKALGSQITDTLASDLKEAAAHLLNENTIEFLKFMITRPCFTKDGTTDTILNSDKNDACEKFDIEIDLYVSSVIHNPPLHEIKHRVEVGKQQSVPPKRAEAKPINSVFTEKTIKEHAFEIDAAIKKNPAIKEYLQTNLKRFCDAAEKRFEIVIPISKKESEKRLKVPMPAKIRKITNPKGQRTPEEDALIDQFNKKCNDPGECPGEGLKLGNELYCSQYIKNWPGHFGVHSWLPVEPANPIGWFPVFDDTNWYDNYYDSLTSEQENIRNAVILAVVHDYGCTKSMKIKDRVIFEGTKYTGKYFERDKFLLDLWNKINSHSEFYLKAGLCEMTIDTEPGNGIENKLRQDGDLSRKPSETGQRNMGFDKKQLMAVINVLGDYEKEHGRKKGISLSDLEQETEQTRYGLLPILNQLGKDNLIEMHKGPKYVSYWLPVELDESPQLRLINSSIWKFRLTETGCLSYDNSVEVGFDGHGSLKIDSLNWDSVLRTSVLEQIDQKYGATANDFAELSDLIIEAQKSFHKELKGKGFIRVGFASESKSCELYLNNKPTGMPYNETRVFCLGQSTYKIVVRIHYSIVKLKHEFITAIRENASSDFYERIRDSLEYGLRGIKHFHDDNKELYFCGDDIQDGKTKIDRILTDLKEWHEISISRTHFKTALVSVTSVPEGQKKPRPPVQDTVDTILANDPGLAYHEKDLFQKVNQKLKKLGFDETKSVKTQIQRWKKKNKK